MLEIGRSCEMPHCGNRHAPAHFPTQGTGSRLAIETQSILCDEIYFGEVGFSWLKQLVMNE
jgi:hypothetical protein